MVLRSEYRKQEFVPPSHLPATPLIVTARGDPPPADHTPSSQRGSRLRRCTSCPLASLRSWRLPDLFFLFKFSDDHDRLDPRRSSSARGVLVAPCCGTALLARRGGFVPPLKRTPTARPSASSRPLGGRAVEGDRPGRRDRPVSLRPGCGRARGHPPVRGNVGTTTCHDTTPSGGKGIRDTRHQKKRG